MVEKPSISRSIMIWMIILIYLHMAFLTVIILYKLELADESLILSYSQRFLGVIPIIFWVGIVEILFSHGSYVIKGIIKFYTNRKLLKVDVNK